MNRELRIPADNFENTEAHDLVIIFDGFLEDNLVCVCVPHPPVGLYYPADKLKKAFKRAIEIIESYEDTKAVERF